MKEKKGRVKMIREKINSYVNPMTVWKACAATTVFAVLLWVIDFSPIGVAGLLEVTGGANILDFEAGYTVDQAYGMLEALGEAGRSFHLTKIMPVDIFFPIGLMLVNYPKRLETVCRITSSVSAVKMVCVKTAVVVLLVLFVWFVFWKIFGLVKLKK